jgi:uncharacterized membrane protein
VELHVKPITMSVELRIRGHVHCVKQVPALKIRLQEFSSARTPRDARVEFTRKICIFREHVVPAGVENQQIVPVLGEDVHTVGVVRPQVKTPVV